MTRLRGNILILVWVLCFGLTSCAPRPVQAVVTQVADITYPTNTPEPSPLVEARQSFPIVSPTAQPSLGATLPVTVAPTSSPTACPPDVCSYAGALLLKRPIAPPGRDSIDSSYRFGSTQAGQRDPHHGVEFLNSTGTPVLAVAEGTVAVAGDDRQVLYGPYYYFYGNLVILKHQLPGITQTVYSLYAHLSEVAVVVGQHVSQGEMLGRVGMSGVATGSHLHFEVRLGENNYQAARNPELWLQPRLAADGTPFGVLAGRILTVPYFNLKISNVVLERLSGPGGESLESLYIDVYQERALTEQPPWQEHFAAGDLPSGWYRVSFVQFGIQSREVQVLPGTLTVVTFDLREQE